MSCCWLLHQHTRWSWGSIKTKQLPVLHQPKRPPTISPLTRGANVSTPQAWIGERLDCILGRSAARCFTKVWYLPSNVDSNCCSLVTKRGTKRNHVSFRQFQNATLQKSKTLNLPCPAHFDPVLTELCVGATFSATFKYSCSTSRFSNFQAWGFCVEPVIVNILGAESNLESQIMKLILLHIWRINRCQRNRIPPKQTGWNRAFSDASRFLYGAVREHWSLGGIGGSISTLKSPGGGEGGGEGPFWINLLLDRISSKKKAFA